MTEILRCGGFRGCLRRFSRRFRLSCGSSDGSLRAGIRITVLRLVCVVDIGMIYGGARRFMRWPCSPLVAVVRSLSAETYICSGGGVPLMHCLRYYGGLRMRTSLELSAQNRSGRCWLSRERVQFQLALAHVDYGLVLAVVLGCRGRRACCGMRCASRTSAAGCPAHFQTSYS